MLTGFWQAASGLLQGYLAHVVAAHRERQGVRRDLGALLAKPGDHLISDIGLTRHEVRHLAGDWHD